MSVTLKSILWTGMLYIFVGCDSNFTAGGEDLSADLTSETSPPAKTSGEDCVDPDLSKVHTSVSLTSCNGELVQGQLKECSEDGQVGCVVVGPLFKSAATSGLDATNIRSGITVAGVTGSLADCNTNNIVGCVTTSAYTSADLTNLIPGNVKNAVVIAGVTGTLAGVPDCGSDGEQGCVTTAAFPAAKASDAVASNIKSGVTIAGTPGNLTPSPANCSSDGQSACVVEGTNYVAASKSNAVAGNIKAGVSLAGVTGDYPSATNRLAGADGTVDDLDFATFNTKIKSSANFEWFDSAGVRYTHAGEPDILSGLFLSGVSVFGTVGSYDPGGMKITSFTASKGVGKISLSWTRTGGSGVIVVRRLEAVVSLTASHGTSYELGSVGDNDIIYKGTAASFEDTDVADGTNYFYRVFVYNADHGYSEPSDFSIHYGVIETCGGAGDGCYNDAAAMAAGLAVTPLGKNLEYVTASGAFKVWKEVGTNRILRANGLDEWAMKLNLSGKGFIGGDGNEFMNYSSLAGRACPTHVYIDDGNKFSTGNCLYYTATTSKTLNADGSSQTDDGTIGLSNWSNYNGGEARWYVGNVQTCATNGMRLPTIYESTTTNKTYPKYPTSDGAPTFAETAGVPSGSDYTWTASACVTSGVCQNDTSLYLLWSNGTAAEYYHNTGTYPLRCVLP